VSEWIRRASPERCTHKGRLTVSVCSRATRGHRLSAVVWVDRFGHGIDLIGVGVQPRGRASGARALGCQRPIHQPRR
jgi:hypothetical protein